LKAQQLFRRCYVRYSKLETYWLRDQILKASGSIGANIAEMGGFESNDMKIHKCSIALGEASELMFWLTTLDNIKDDEAISILNDIQKMLFSLRRHYTSAKSQEPRGK
jgi:four helix bundle protein